MRTFWRFFVAFLAVAGAVAILTGFLGIRFKHFNYWDYHGILFLISIAFFPRLTLLLSTVPFGGLLWWLSWLFAPRLLVAILATLNYWNQNPFLVVVSWLVATGGESSEKFVMVHRPSWKGRWATQGTKRRKSKNEKWVDAEVQDP